jgi:hypothetical protein
MRTIKITLAGTALISIAVLGSSTGPAQSAATAATSCTPKWNLVTLPASPGPGADLRSVTALSARDVWITGQGLADPSFQYEPWTLHGSGRSFTTRPSPPRIPRSDLFFGSTSEFALHQGASFSSDTEGWALAGTGGDSDFKRQPVAEHWHGGRWTMVPWAVPSDPAATAAVPRDIAAVSPNDAWAVGALFVSTSTIPPGDHPVGAVIEHWDGTDWSLVPNPASNQASTMLEMVDARSASDIWAVGQLGGDSGKVVPLVEHFDGTAWRVIPTPAVGDPAGLTAVSATGPNDVWAVGDHDETGAPVPLVEHFDGTTWKAVTNLPDIGNVALHGVYAADPGSVWVIARDSQAVLHWDGKAWTASRMPGPPELGLDYRYNAIDGTGPNDVWAVGRVTNLVTNALTSQVAHLSCGRG